MTDRVAAVWETIGHLTYAEMIEVAAQLRDAGVCAINCDDEHAIAHMIDVARSAYLEQGT